MRVRIILTGIVLGASLIPLTVKAQVNIGDKIYADQCLSCHAKDGSGSTPRGKAMKVPDLRTPQVQKKTDAELIDGIVKAKAHTGFRKKLGGEEIRKVVAYMRTLK